MKPGQLPFTGLVDSKAVRYKRRLEALRQRKPNLKLCSNHIKKERQIKRVWNRGTAVSDGKGWYKHA